MNSILARIQEWWNRPGIDLDVLDGIFVDPDLCDCEVCLLVQAQDEADEDEYELYGDPG